MGYGLPEVVRLMRLIKKVTQTVMQQFVKVVRN